MKKAMMMVAAMGMFGGAFADKTTVVQPVSVEVANVCTYAPGAMSNVTTPPVTPEQNPALPYNQTNVNGLTYTQGNVDLGTYRANGTAGGSASTYIFRCTKNTSWTAPTGDVTLVLMSGANKLNVVATRKDDAVNDDGNNSGDIHNGSVSFKVPTGQYSSAAGHYSGDLTLEISYF